MKCSAERLIEALIGIELARERKAAQQLTEQRRKASYVVTISRGLGSLGSEVCGALAERLGVDCCDRMILEEVARRADVDIELVETLDENVKHLKIKPWEAIFKGKSYSKERYLHHLVKVILSLSQKGGVILGRGAHLILGPDQAFRVRIIGTLDVCARRVAEREKVDINTAKRRVETVNRERTEYIHALYGANIRDCSDYDLVINSDRFSVAQIVDMILHAMVQAGYELTGEMLQTA